MQRSLLVPDRFIAKSSSWCFDIRTASDTTTACFTKSYSRYIKGTGSVLLINNSIAAVTEGVAATGNNKRGREGEDAGKADEHSRKVTSAVDGIGGTYETQECVRLTRCQHSVAGAASFPSVIRNGVNYENSAADVSTTIIEERDGASSMRCEDANVTTAAAAVAVAERSFSTDWWLQLNPDGTKQLRYFSPSELLRIFGFSASFRFPPSVSNRKAYELIGNSLNVVVVAKLFSYMLEGGVGSTGTSCSSSIGSK
jgi:hypothetical protein